MKTTKHKKGFTIPELMIALVAVAVLSLTVGLILIQGWRGWNASRESVEMQRDASIALRVISREIRCSEYTNMTFSTGRIQFEVGGVRTNSEAIYLQNGSLIHSGGGFDFTLIGGGVTEFNPTADDAAKSVDVTIGYASDSGYDSGSKTFTVYTRNDS